MVEPAALPLNVRLLPATLPTVLLIVPTVIGPHAELSVKLPVLLIVPGIATARSRPN